MLLHSKKLLTFYCILYYYDIFMSLSFALLLIAAGQVTSKRAHCARTENWLKCWLYVCVNVVDNCGSLGKYNNLKRLNKIIQLFMLVKQTVQNEATWPTKKTSGYPVQFKFMLYIPLYIYMTGVCV